MRSDDELSLELSHLVLGLNQVLRIEISIRSDSLVQVLLLLELAFELDVLFLELTDQVLLQFDLFHHLHEVGVGLGCLVREPISVFLESVDLSQQIGDVLLLGSALLLELGDLVLLVGDLILVLVVLVFGLLDRLLHHVSEPDQVNDLLLVLFGVSPEMFDLSGQSVDSVLGDVLLVLGLLLLPGDSVLVVLEGFALSRKLVDVLLHFSDGGLELVDLHLLGGDSVLCLRNVLLKVVNFVLRVLQACF